VTRISWRVWVRSSNCCSLAKRERWVSQIVQPHYSGKLENV